MKSTLKRALALMLTLTLALALAPLTQPSASAAGDDWKAAYAELLSDYSQRTGNVIVNGQTGDTLFFGLADIDRNGVPELLVPVDDTLAGGGGDVWTYSGKLIEAGWLTSGAGGLDVTEITSANFIGLLNYTSKIYNYWITWVTLVNNELTINEEIVYTFDGWSEYGSEYYGDFEVAKAVEAGTLETKPIEFYEATPENIAKYIYGYGDSSPSQRLPYADAYLKILQDNKTRIINAEDWGWSKAEDSGWREGVVVKDIVGDSTPELIYVASPYRSDSVELSVWTFDGVAKNLLDSAYFASGAGAGYDFDVKVKNGIIFARDSFSEEGNGGRTTRRYELKSGKYALTDKLYISYSYEFDDNWDIIEESYSYKYYLDDNSISKDEYNRRIKEIDGATELIPDAMTYAEAVIFLYAATVPALSATPTGAKVQVNGKDIPFDAYTINGQTYYQLADIARSVSGTTKQFSAAFKDGAIYVTRGTAMFGSISPKGTGNKTPTPTQAKIYIDGAETAITAYTMDGHTYYQMKAVAEAFNFAVGFANGTITVDTSKSYGA